MEFIIGAVLLYLIIKLQGRVKDLEEQVRSGRVLRTEPAPATPVSPTQIREQAQGQEREQMESRAQTAYQKTGPDFSERLIAWIKEDWLIKLGALLLIIGFAWLATYAFLNNWIGPMGRIALGLAAGTAILLLGWWRMKSFPHQGGVFLVVGSTAILLTMFAAREYYDFFTPLTALIVMFLSTAFVALASVQYRARTLSLISLALAGAAPLLTGSPDPDVTGLFTYLFVAVLGAIWIVVVTGWRELTGAALILITFYSLSIAGGLDAREMDILLLFAYAFATLFFLTNTLGLLKLKEKDAYPDIITAAGNGLFLVSWIIFAASPEWQSIIISAWMIVFVAGAFIIFHATGRREPFYTYAGIGIGMLATATALELDGAALTIAYLFESAIVAFVTYFVLKDINLAERMSLLIIGPLILSLESMNARIWKTKVFHEDFFVLFLTMLVLLLMGIFFYGVGKQKGRSEASHISAALILLGTLYAYILLWLSLHAALLNDDTAVMIALVIYTLIGIGSYIYGRTKESKLVRVYGELMLGFVVLRLLTVDVWKMELVGRIITFFVIGALLMSTAFIRTKKKVVESSDNELTQTQ